METQAISRCCSSALSLIRLTMRLRHPVLGHLPTSLLTPADVGIQCLNLPPADRFGKQVLLLLLQFTVMTAPDERFERRGADLHHNATITLVDALVGFSTKVTPAFWILPLQSAMSVLPAGDPRTRSMYDCELRPRGALRGTCQELIDTSRGHAYCCKVWEGGPLAGRVTSQHLLFLVVFLHAPLQFGVALDHATGNHCRWRT